MSDPQSITPEQFSDMVDRFITLANEIGNTLPRARVNAAFMFAAARYNAFNWSFREVMLEQTLDEATAAHRGEYENMFRNNATELMAIRAKG